MTHYDDGQRARSPRSANSAKDLGDQREAWPPGSRHREDLRTMTSLQKSAGNRAVSNLLATRRSQPVVQGDWIAVGPHIDRWRQPANSHPLPGHRTWYRRRESIGKFTYRYDESAPGGPAVGRPHDVSTLFAARDTWNIDFPAVLDQPSAPIADTDDSLLQLSESSLVIPVERLDTAKVEAFTDPALQGVSLSWQLREPQRQAIVLETDDSPFSFSRDHANIFHTFGYGTYRLSCIARTGQGVARQSVDVKVLGPGNQHAVRLEAPEKGQYLGSHWTTTLFDKDFSTFGLREFNTDAYLGEGLYTTTDEALGIQAALGIIQRMHGGDVREWKVYSLAETFTSVAPHNVSEQPLPFRMNPQTAAYVRDYDALTADTPELKVNPCAFGKVVLVPQEPLDARSAMTRLAKTNQK